MKDFEQVFPHWRLYFALLIGLLFMCVMYQIYKTCVDIAACKDDLITSTPPQMHSSERKVTYHHGIPPNQLVQAEKNKIYHV